MQKLLFALIVAFLLFISCSQNGKEAMQQDMESRIASIVDNISEPLIPDFSLNLCDAGGLGDSLTDNRAAFARALEQLEKEGGGRLIVPPGNYRVNGPIHLKSNTELHLQEGARLFFGANSNDYLPVVKTSWEGTFLYNYSPFIYAHQCTHVAITGKGCIDGEASETWSTWSALQEADQLLSREMNHKSAPIEERIFGKGHYLRPHLVQFFDCHTVKVEGIQMEDSPFWCLHLLRCENVVVRGVSFHAHNRNNDGIDPEYSRNVLIEQVRFDNSDDNVAIKAGRDHEGRAAKQGSENIVVRNCHFKGLHALVIGSEMSAGVKNVFVCDCDFAGYLKRGIYLKSNPDRGGFIRNIYAKNLQFGAVEDAIYITSFYHNEGAGHTTDIRDVFLEDLRFRSASGTGIVIQGYPGKKVRDIWFTNVTIDTAANALSMSDAENIVLGNVRIGKLATAPTAVR
ncbi:MAG TPA: glycoside hydrolase family 28 protein [Prolixibacteraceae bacterium]|nr:glycoside hydrolase family 28 protein [Prolixibacteraceae bacterium]